MADYSEDYLLDKRVKIFQPREGYRASTDAVLLAATVAKVKNGDSILDIGSGTGAVALCITEQFKNSDIKICGVELQTELAALANMSAQANGFTAVKFFNENIFKTTMPFPMPNTICRHRKPAKPRRIISEHTGWLTGLP